MDHNLLFLFMQRANLIGVDSLGMDVRVFSGMEAQTIRFSFNARVSFFFKINKYSILKKSLYYILTFALHGSMIDDLFNSK